MIGSVERARAMMRADDDDAAGIPDLDDPVLDAERLDDLRGLSLGRRPRIPRREPVGPVHADEMLITGVHRMV